MPFYEAGTERFIRNWEDTVLRVVVRDSALREHDPILGVVNMPLKDLFAGSSEVTRLYSLQDGIGFGKANISVLFKAVEADLPPNLRGWDTGTVEVLSSVRLEVPQEKRAAFSNKKLNISTNTSNFKIPSAEASVEGDAVVWNVDSQLRLPTYDRYSTAICFEVGSGPEALAPFWLQDIEDDVEREVRIPILTAQKPTQLRQNYINAQTAKTHTYEVIGHLIVTLRLDSGLDPDFERYAAEDRNTRHEFEAYDRVDGMAEVARKNAHFEDDAVIDKKEKKEIERARKKELESRQRGVAQFKPYRTGKWMKDGLKLRGKKIKNAIVGIHSQQQPSVETET